MPTARSVADLPQPRWLLPDNRAPRTPQRLTLASGISPEGTTAVIIQGELDIATADQAVAYVRSAINNHRAPVLLNLAALAFCDARGLAALVRMRALADQAGCTLHLVSPPPQLCRIIRIAGLDGRLPVRVHG